MYGVEFVKSNITVVLAWVAGCIGMSTFTMMAALKVESANLM